MTRIKYYAFKSLYYALMAVLGLAGALIVLPIVIGGWITNVCDYLEHRTDKLKKEIEDDKE